MKKQSKAAKKVVRPKAKATATKKKPASKGYVNPHSVTRSISFKKELYAHLKQRALKEGRSVNWLVNDLVRKDTATPAAQP